MRVCVKGQGEQGGREKTPVFNFVYIYIASANLFPFIGEPEKHSHWIV